MTEQCITFDNVSFEYPNGKQAVDNLSLTVNKGEIYCLFGSNGAGKTTSIDMLLGFLHPTSGKIIVNGLESEKELDGVKHFLSYLSENVRLYGDFTGYQNLSFFSKLRTGRALSKSEAASYLNKVGLHENCLSEKISSFSKGMRQKLGLAICISQNTEVLVLDEPMSGLDPKAANELTETLCKLKDENKTIFMSTHDIFRAKRFASKVAIMSDGKKIKELDSSEFSNIDFESIYLDSVA